MAQIFIGQLPFSKFFPDDLLNLFRPYGNVVAHQLHIRQGNAFVTYTTTDEADAAIRALHGQCALGTRSQPIQVMYSKGTRLISPFGLQHRSLCLARNKDRQKSKRGSSEGDAQSASNNDSVSLNDGTQSHPGDFATVIYTANTEEMMNGAGGAGMATYFSRGPSDVSFDEDGRPVMTNNTNSNSSIFTHSTTYSVGHIQQQPNGYLPGMMGMEGVAYGAPVKWTLSPPGLLPIAANNSTSNNNNNAYVSGTGLCSPLSSPAAPPLPSAPAAPASLSYVVMQPPSSGVAMAGGLPICYVMPTAAGPVYLSSPHHQPQAQQQAMNAMMNPFGAATMMPSPLAYVQMRPM